MLKVLDVDGAVHRVSGGWEPTGQPWSYDAERYARVAAERSREQQAMLDYASAGGCRMEYLRRELDDPAAGRAGAATTAPDGTGPLTSPEPAPPPPASGCSAPASTSRRGGCGRPG